MERCLGRGGSDGAGDGTGSVADEEDARLVEEVGLDDRSGRRVGVNDERSRRGVLRRKLLGREWEEERRGRTG